MYVTQCKSLAVCFCLVAAMGCSDYSQGKGSPNYGEYLERDAAYAVESFQQTDPSMQRFFDTSVGYAVFPGIDKGGAGLGGAHGEGVLYERNDVQVQPVGYCEMSQGTLGAQLGGQKYRQIIFFENAVSLDRFKQGQMEFAGQASAVAAASGAAASADYDEGVAVFTQPRKGLMFEASIGGQKFTYTPKTMATLAPPESQPGALSP